MKTMNTSVERVDWMIEQSKEIHTEIDEMHDGELRYDRILRIGINTLAIALKEGLSVSEAGALLNDIPLNNPATSGPLDSLAYEYGKVTRATLDNNYVAERDARHAVHLMKLAPRYAAEFYPELDVHHITAAALSHDLVEARAGDTNSLGLTKAGLREKKLREATALRMLHKEFDDTFPEIISFVDDYEALKTPEDRFTKGIDKFDPGFTHLANKGFQLLHLQGLQTADQFRTEIGKSEARMETYMREFPLLMEDKYELTRRIIKVTYEKAA